MTIATITKRLRTLASEALTLAHEIELADTATAKAHWRATAKAETLIELVCRNFELTPEMIRARARTPRVTHGRLVFLALGRKFKLASDMDLARMVCRERSLVSHAIGAVADYCETNPQFAAKVNAIAAEFTQRFAITYHHQAAA